MQLKPDVNNSLFEILKGLPKEDLELIFRKRDMAYTKTEKKRNLGLIGKVYRELINLNTIKDFFRRIGHTNSLMDIVFYIFLNNGEVRLSDIEQKYGKYSIDRVNLLGSGGIVFTINKGGEDKVILPLEYFFILVDDYINKRHPVNPDTLIKGLYMYSSDEIKKVAAYLNNTYRESFDTTNAKIYCTAMCYSFIIKNKQRLYDQLTLKQREILNFVLENNNYIEAKELVKKYPLKEEDYQGGWYGYPSMRDVLNICNYKTHREEKPDIKKLFFIGFLIPIGDIYNSLKYVSIPIEVHDIVAKEYIGKINRKKEQTASKMLLPPSQNPSKFLTNPDISENLKKFLLAVTSTHPKINKNGSLAKKSYPLISRIAGFNEEETEFFFVLCSENKWIRSKKSAYMQGNEAFISDAGIDLMREDTGVQKLRVVEKGLETTAWNEFHVEKNRYLQFETHESKLSKDVKKTILLNLRQHPDSWIDTELFLSYLRLDADLKKIESKWNDVKAEERHKHSYYYEEQPSRYKTFKEGVNEVYMTLFHLGLLHIVTEGNNDTVTDTVTRIRLSKLGKSFLLNKKELKASKMMGGESGEDSMSKLIVQPNNEILTGLEGDIETQITLSKFAYPKKIDKFCVYEITKESVMRSASEGFLQGEIMDFLKKHSDKGIPPTVISLIGDHSSKYGEIEIKECAGCMIFKDEVLMNEVLSSKSLRKGMEQDRLNGGNIILIKDKSMIDEIYKRLQQRGYGVKKE